MTKRLDLPDKYEESSLLLSHCSAHADFKSVIVALPRLYWPPPGAPNPKCQPFGSLINPFFCKATDLVTDFHNHGERHV